MTSYMHYVAIAQEMGVSSEMAASNLEQQAKEEIESARKLAFWKLKPRIRALYHALLMYVAANDIRENPMMD